MSATILDTAARWTSIGAGVLALHGVRPDGSCRCRPPRPRPPCPNAGKHPMAAVCPRGVHSAVADPEIARQIWEEHSAANIAVACGSRLTDGRYLVGLDVDPRNGGDETIGALEIAHGSLPTTVRQLSGRGDGGGIAWYGAAAAVLAWSDGGIDLLGSGKYGVTVGSRHAAGGLYTWDAGAHPDDVPIADLPGWLVRSRGVRKAAPRPALGDACDTWLGVAFGAMGWLGDRLAGGKRMVRCPWSDLHSDGRGQGEDSSSVLIAPSRGLARVGSFACAHGCKDRPLADVLDALSQEAIAAAHRRYPDATALVLRRAEVAA